MAQSESAIPSFLLPRTLLEQLNADLDALEADVVPTWEGLVDPLERVSDRLGRSWGAVGHLKVETTSQTDFFEDLMQVASNAGQSYPRLHWLLEHLKAIAVLLLPSSSCGTNGTLHRLLWANFGH